jgi:hypothetical protein
MQFSRDWAKLGSPVILSAARQEKETTMPRLLAICALLVLLTPSAFAEDVPAKMELPTPGADGKIALFNGKDLTGWYGEPGLFSVDNGEIVGKTEKGLKRNEFLKSRFEGGDFRLTLKIKLVPHGANSGVQFRSQPHKGNEMKGYQADAGAGWWGKLYEEEARGILVKEGGEQFLNKEDWNTYEIVAVGHKIMIALNGHKTVDLDDEKGATRGIFALQVHAGGPTEVRFKDLVLEPNPKAELVTVTK